MFLKKIVVTILLILIPAPAFAVSFFVDPSYDIEARGQVEASLREQGENIKFYLEDQYWNSLSSTLRNKLTKDLNNLIDEFDQNIYAKMRETYGEEWSPGIDNDPRIIVLITQMDENAGGYFNPNDGFLKEEVERSNEKDMFYLNVFHIGDYLAKSFLAHEFQHLINFNQKIKLNNVQEEVWVNEGLSEYAPTVSGYDEDYANSNLKKRVENFLKMPSHSLTEWTNSSYDYSSMNLFMQYFIDHFGESTLKYIENNNQAGIQSINNALDTVGYKDTFEDIFTNWIIASFLNDCSQGEYNEYCYLNPNLRDLRIKPNANYNLTAGMSLSIGNQIKDWAPFWYKFSGISNQKKALQIDFQAQDLDANFVIPYIVIDKSGQALVDFIPINQDGASDTVYISGFGRDINSVILIPSNQNEKYNFSNSGLARFDLSVAMIEPISPVIESIEPISGSVKGGMEVTISGKNFMENSRVEFGKILLEEFEFISEEIIKVNVPKVLEAGIVSITITNTDGEKDVLKQAFIYIAETGQEASPHPNGSLIVYNGAVWKIENGERRGFPGQQVLNSYQYDGNSIVAESNLTSADKALAEGTVMPYKTGSLISDAEAVWMIGDSLSKRGFTSAENFTGNGYSWNKVIASDITLDQFNYTEGTVISNTTDAHPAGTLIKYNDAVWKITADGKRQGAPSPEVLNSYQYDWETIVDPNTADEALAETSTVMQFRDGTLVSDNGAVWIISDSKKRLFPGPEVFDELGYNWDMVIEADLSGYEIGEVISL